MPASVHLAYLGSLERIAPSLNRYMTVSSIEIFPACCCCGRFFSSLLSAFVVVLVSSFLPFFVFDIFPSLLSFWLPFLAFVARCLSLMIIHSCNTIWYNFLWGSVRNNGRCTHVSRMILFSFSFFVCLLRIFFHICWDLAALLFLLMLLLLLLLAVVVQHV